MPGNNMAFDPDAVVLETEIAAPPERVFQALVDQKQLFTWGGASLRWN